MMRCKTCYQEYTAIDFVALRNLCEHVYLDSLAQKGDPSLPRSSETFSSVRTSPPGSESLIDVVAVK
jgi:hypothetical protein